MVSPHAPLGRQPSQFSKVVQQFVGSENVLTERGPSMLEIPLSPSRSLDDPLLGTLCRRSSNEETSKYSCSYTEPLCFDFQCVVLYATN